jgi:deoxyhypusine synthase
MTVDDEIRRAEEAERIYNNPILKEAFDLVEKGVIDAIKQSKLGDDRTHTKLAMMLQTIEQVRKHFKTTMDTGKLARIQKETLAEQVKRRLGR